MDAVDVELLLDDVPQLGIRNGERLALAVLLDELAQAFAQLALHQRRRSAQRRSRVVKLVKRGQLNHLQRKKERGEFGPTLGGSAGAGCRHKHLDSFVMPPALQQKGRGERCAVELLAPKADQDYHMSAEESLSNRSKAASFTVSLKAYIRGSKRRGKEVNVV